MDPKKINRTDYDEISDRLKKWLNNIKHNYCPDLKYLIVPELHKDGKSYHFHGLMADIKGLTLIDSGKKFQNKFGEMVKIYNLKEFPYGFTNFQKISKPERVTKYITKYISKELCAVTEGKKRYWASRNLNKPKVNIEMVTQDDEFMEMMLNCSGYTKSIEIDGTKQIITILEM